MYPISPLTAHSTKITALKKHCFLVFLIAIAALPLWAVAAQNTPPQTVVNTIKPQKTATPIIPYENLRRLYQKHFNRCDLLNELEVLSLSTTPLANIKSEQKKWYKTLRTTQKDRALCYKDGYTHLKAALTKGLNNITKEKDTFYLQNFIMADEHALDLYRLKEKVQKRLFLSLEEDLTKSLGAYKKKYTKKRKKDRPTFVIESTKTAQLIQQNIALVLALENRELTAQEHIFLYKDTATKSFIDLKIQQTLHYLTKALVAYEYLGHKNPNLLLTKLRTEYIYATGHLQEVLARMPELTPMPKDLRPHFLQLTNRMELLELDIEGALRDYKQRLHPEDIESWLSELYQDVSSLATALNNTRRELFIEAPIISDDVALPADIVNFIQEQEKPKEIPQKKKELKNKEQKSKKPQNTPQKKERTKSTSTIEKQKKATTIKVEGNNNTKG